MSAFTSQRSGNWSRASNNADSPWYDGGAQTALARVPGSTGTDTATVAAGHTVSYDYDMSAAGVMTSIVLNGTLVASTSPGSYYLKMGGTAGQNITYGASGSLQAGSSGTAYPSGCVFTLDLNGASAIVCTGAGSTALALYCLEPTWNAVVIGAESIGATVLDITGYRRASDGVVETGKDLTTDTMWAAARDVRINHVRTWAVDSEARTIATSGIAATSVTVTSGLTNAKTAGSNIVLTWRNVRIIGHTGTTGAIQGASGCTIGCEIALGSAGYGLASTCASCIIERGVWHSGSRGINACIGFTIQGSVVFTGNSIGIYSGTGFTIQGSAAFTGNSNGIYSGTGFTIQGSAVFSWNTNGISVGTGFTIQGSVVFSGNSNGISASSVRWLSGAVFSTNTNDLYGACLIDGDGSTLASTTQFGNYRASVMGESIRTVVWNIGAVAGAVKAWMYGGRVASVATQPTNWPGGVPWVQSYEHTLEAATHRCWLEKPIWVQSGQKVTVDIYIQQSATGMTVPAVAVLASPDDVTPVPASPLATATIAANTDWQKLTLTYTATYDRRIMLRVYAANASGTVTWRDVVTLGGGGGAPRIGSCLIRSAG